MTLKYLVTGVTGNLGGAALRYLLESISKSLIGAASSNPSNRSKYEALGIQFRHLDFDDPQSLADGLDGVENVLFVSTGSNRRPEQHGNFINAAKEVGVTHVYYTSLVFGGYSNNSQIPVMQDHLLTERLLKESGINYTSVREGIYAEAFGIMTDWYPEQELIRLPADGKIAFTSRVELAEATARLMVRGGHDRQIVLLTSGEALSPPQVVDVINETTGRQVKVEFLPRDEYIRHSLENNPRNKPKEHYEMVASWWEEFAHGSASTTDPLMADLLEREPTKSTEAIKQLLQGDRDYTYS